MDKKTIIDSLIACNKTQWNEEHRDFLETLDEDKLVLMQAVDEEPETPPAEGAEGEGEDKTNPPTPDKAKIVEPDPAQETTDNAAQPTLEEFIANAPTEVRDALTGLIDTNKTVKATLVDALLENDRCRFTREQLEQMDIPTLNGMTELGRIPVDFSASGGGPAHVDEPRVPVIETIPAPDTLGLNEAKNDA